MNACVFCEIIAGRAPATLVDSTPRSLLIVPLSPVTDGHVLVIPREHVADASTRPWVTAEAMADAAVWAGAQDRPFNLLTSAGEEATQSVFHLHVHYVPRAADDGLMLPWGTLHGEDPKAPHRCRRIVELEQRCADAGAPVPTGEGWSYSPTVGQLGLCDREDPEQAAVVASEEEPRRPPRLEREQALRDEL